jgi:hypothetical protein
MNDDNVFAADVRHPEHSVKEIRIEDNFESGEFVMQAATIRVRRKERFRRGKAAEVSRDDNRRQQALVSHVLWFNSLLFQHDSSPLSR